VQVQGIAGDGDVFTVIRTRRQRNPGGTWPAAEKPFHSGLPAGQLSRLIDEAKTNKILLPSESGRKLPSEFLMVIAD